MKKIVLLLAILTSTVSDASIENREFDSSHFRNLIVKNAAGNLKVTPSKSTKVLVSTKKVQFGSNCQLQMKVSGNALILEVKKLSHKLNNNCEVNFEIKVPQETALKLKTGSGNLDIEGNHQSIDFDLGSGNLILQGNTKNIEGETGSGDIKASGRIEKASLKTGSGALNIVGLTGSAQLKTGSGDLTIHYSTPPLSGNLEINTGSGDVTVFLPASTRVSTQFNTGSGQISNELGNTADASFKVSIRSGSGDLQLKKTE